MDTRNDIQVSLKAALPVMLGYIAIGIPCGVMEREVGIGPLGAFLVSGTFYSGAGQFMLSTMLLAGAPIASIALSIGLVSSRQMLYSAAFSPFFAKVRRRLSVLFAALVANDILDPDLWDASPLLGLVPIVSALAVVPIAKRSRSLVWSALAGMCVYALLGYCVSLAG